MNKTYGIMFTAENILAYIAGRKTQTRRLKGLKEINQHPDEWELIFSSPTAKFVTFARKDVDKKETFKHITLPYGKAGDTLWFKETYHIEKGLLSKNSTAIFYRADTQFDVKKWRSSMLMPMKYSRFQNIPILNVRAERLHTITQADAQAEGVIANPPTGFIHSADYVSKYMQLWDRINSKTMPSEKNPWVFVYDFPKYKGASQ